MISEKIFDHVRLLIWTYFPKEHRTWLVANCTLSKNTSGYIKALNQLKVWELEYLDPSGPIIDEMDTAEDLQFSVSVSIREA